MPVNVFNLPRELKTAKALDFLTRGLKDKSFENVRKLRDRESMTGARRDAFAALDRGAFAQLIARKEGPLVAAAISFGIPIDFIVKELGIKVKGLFEGGSKPGLVGIKEGIKGIGRGLRLFGQDIKHRKLPVGRGSRGIRG